MYIVETITTTMSPAGEVNIAPLGPYFSEDEIIFRLFPGSTSHANLRATGEAVVHITDNVELIAHAALERVSWPTEPAPTVRGAVLPDACRFYEVRVHTVDDSGERHVFTCDVVGRGWQRDFLGFNRAKHAVLEAAILATRLHLTGKEPVLAEYEKLAVTVSKTGEAQEARAMAFLKEYVRRWEPR
ncbi:MAG: DUF447 family protein [Ardenticatenaceae bacterium]|nr:DUF447 family protein [Ardenticatenaceae bacterium]